MTFLVTVAHGSRDDAGNEMPQRITAAALAELGWPGLCAYVELAYPAFEQVMEQSRMRTVALPLLLSTGFHMMVDLPRAVATARAPVVLGPALGPHPLLASAQVGRLTDAGAVPGQPVVMVAAGSRHEPTEHDLARARELLAEAWGAEVLLATLSGAGRRPAEVVTPDHAVSPYLLSGGYFAERAGEEARAAVGEGIVVGEVLGDHADVVRLVVERARSLAG